MAWSVHHDRSTDTKTTRQATAPERHGTGPGDGGTITLDELDYDPYPSYRWLRERGVVWVESVNRWMVTLADDVGAVETAREHFSANETSSNLTRVIGHQMLRADADAHKRLRSAAQDPLRQTAVKDRATAFQRIADELVDGFVERGRGDLIADFAAPFAGLCLAEILGLPDVTPADVERWSRGIMAGASNYADDPQVWTAAQALMDQVDASVEAALEGSGPPKGSIIDAMVSSDGAGRPLTVDEVKSNVKVMIGGGFNEPRDAVGTAVWALLNHPDQLAAVRVDEGLWPRVVEETVRWVAPIGVAPREVVQPIRFGDTELEPGARVMVNFASANRDELHWDRPDAFDITRPRRRNVAFGVGHHFCLGVWMARHQIGVTALPTLFRRLPDLQVDLDRPPRIRGWVFRGPLDLWLSWTPV